ncbi:MAG: phytoene desaturase family protein [Cytophagales bacterium]
MKNSEILIIGSGIGSLSAACLLAQKGKKVTVVEQNYLPGGCVSSYWRKGFVFEAGATTLVGLDKGQPLHYLLDTLGIDLPARKLDLPMQIKMKNGHIINRHENIEEWIHEAKAEFGFENQEAFWRFCFKISQFVWDTSLRQRTFPISSWSDLLNSALHATPSQLWNARWSLYSMQDLLIKFNLHYNNDFVDFVNAQLLITAQNTIENVNVLFGATALCYTNYGNYYLDGGLISLSNSLVEYIKSHGGEVIFKENVASISRNNANKYEIKTSKSEYVAEYVVSGIPLNNSLKLFGDVLNSKLQSKTMQSAQLNSAFQMGIGFKKSKKFVSIHHQIHLQVNLPHINAKTIFVSLTHPEDNTRCDDPTTMVASVSTHWPDPEKTMAFDKAVLENLVIDALVNQDFFKKEDIIYYHSSTPEAWEKWTNRAFGFVGGYPQFMNIKPWQMQDARLDGHKAYIVGDSVYPGQGIPGVTLSGIIAFEKMKRDWF